MKLAILKKMISSIRFDEARHNPILLMKKGARALIWSLYIFLISAADSPTPKTYGTIVKK